MKARTTIVAAIILLMVVSTGCTRIGAGQVGIVISMAGDRRGVNDIPTTTGWVFYNPIATSVFEYPTFMQTAVWSKSPHEGNAANEEITFTTADSMQVAIDVSIGYTLLPEKVPHFYVKFRSDDLNTFTHGFFRNLAREKIDGVAGKFRIEQIMGDNAAFLTAARTEIQAAVEPYGIKLEQFGLTSSPRPPEAVIKAINDKIAATQLAIQKQNELVQAQADAAKFVAKSDGEAKSILLIAKAQAEANVVVANSITDKLIEIKRIEKWNGVLSQVTGGQALIDLRK